MTRSPSVEPFKASKRKGTRSVSTLTPTQLARKRANDREAQRAIRARTKDHIERLEQELDQLRNRQGREENREQTVEDLTRENRRLEEEISQLREQCRLLRGSGAVPAPRPYPSPVYEESLPANSSGVSSRDYNSPVPEFGSGSFIHSTEHVDAWQPGMTASVPSTVSSPTSTANDEGFGYGPTSAPAVLDATGRPPTSMPLGTVHKGYDMEYDEVERDPTYSRGQQPAMQTHYLSSSGWSIYQAPNIYYSPSPTM